ncbi:MAG: helix-turn-helix transcriptional regulator [Bacteroidota bacterium]
MENQKSAAVHYAPQQIVKARKKQGYSQEELALTSGLSLRTVQRIERGNVQPRLYSLRALAKALNCRIEDFKLMPANRPQQQGQLVEWMRLAVYSVVILPFLPLLLQVLLWYRAREWTTEEANHCLRLLHFQGKWLVGLVFALIAQPVLVKLLTGQKAYGQFPLGLLIYGLFVGGNLVSIWWSDNKSTPITAMT